LDYSLIFKKWTIFYFIEFLLSINIFLFSMEVNSIFRYEYGLGIANIKTVLISGDMKDEDQCQLLDV